MIDPLLPTAERLWADLEKNELGGYSGINRPFWILQAFREVINHAEDRTIARNKEMLAGWRGRRLRTCRVIEELNNIIESLVFPDDGKDLPPKHGLPAPLTEAHMQELQNMTTVLLRLILIANDGNVSPQRLSRF